MTPTRPTALSTYARAIERRWQGVVERPVVLSLRDWECIRSWHSQGIPLRVVEAAIDDAVAGGSGKRRRRPRSLSALAPLVEEEWKALAAARISPEVARDVPRPRGREPRDAWLGAIESAPPGSALRVCIMALLADLDRGVPAEELDRRMDADLPGCAPGALVESLEAGIDRDLAPHRDRMPASAVEETRSRALAERLRDCLGLPRLAGPEGDPYNPGGG